MKITYKHYSKKKPGLLLLNAIRPGELNREVSRLGDARINKDPHQLRADSAVIQKAAMREKH